MSFGPPPSDRMLRLRPSNVLSRFGAASRLPILDPRDLLGSLAQSGTPSGGALLSLRVPVREALPGLLRAAREVDAPLGLTCPNAAADPQTAHVFGEALAAAISEVSHDLPLFLEAGPVRISGLAQVEPMISAIHRCVEAGFTLVSLEVASLQLDDAIQAVQQLAAPVIERDLSLEVDLPLATDAATWLTALRAARVSPAQLRVSSARAQSFLALGVDGLAAELAQLSTEAEAFGVALAVEEPPSGVPGGIAAMAAAGARKVRTGGAFARPVIRALPEALRQQLSERAMSNGLSLEELIFLVGERLPAFDAEAQLKIEALSFGAALDLLTGLGLGGLGRAMVSSFDSARSVRGE